MHDAANVISKNAFPKNNLVHAYYPISFFPISQITS